MVPAVLNSLVDADARVRYYACEALYNIAKMSREDFLEPHFNSTFDALFRLVADPDAAVNQACTFLDSLMKVQQIPTPLNQLLTVFTCAHSKHSVDGQVGTGVRMVLTAHAVSCCGSAFCMADARAGHCDGS